jgi:hypothetical protein
VKESISSENDDNEGSEVKDKKDKKKEKENKKESTSKVQISASEPLKAENSSPNSTVAKDNVKAVPQRRVRSDGNLGASKVNAIKSAGHLFAIDGSDKVFKD